MRRIGVLFIALVLLSCGPTTRPEPPTTPVSEATVPAVPADGIDLDRVLPLDPRIRVGKLDNGLTYYILEHQKPAKRAQLRLGVNAGSVLEDDDQRGLAHYVEHMAFNGTAKYEKMAIVDYLEGIGMQFGPEVNAYTSFDQTVYMIQVPTDDDEIVTKGFDILGEWASAVTFDAKEVEKERGVVLEEWRLGRGAWMRILDKQYPLLFRGSRYAERLPIGTKEIITGAPREALVRFYEDWYRPDLMTVVAVGDFDAGDIERKIKERFSKLKGPDKPRPRPAYRVPAHAETLISVETDKEMPRTQVTIYNKIPHRSERTVGDYRGFVADQLYHHMLGARLDELRQQPDSPLVMAYSRTGDLVRTVDVFGRTAFAKEGRVEDALRLLFEEVLRVERHGFTATELKRAKKKVLRNYEVLAVERDKTHGDTYADEILRHYFEAEMMPGIAAELELVKQLLPGFTAEELDRLARTWGGAENRVILVSGPDRMQKPSSDQILAWVQAVESKQIAAYTDAVPARPLMAATPKPGSVTSASTVDELGVIEWTLSNGARVILKPTDFKNDEIRLSAFSPGGHSLVSDADFDSARHAVEVVVAGGVGGLDSTALHKALAGKVAEVKPRIGELEEGLSGRASPRDLETFMQLVHLRFTAPRRDAKAFAAWKSRKMDWIRNKRLSPETAFYDDVSEFLSSGHLRYRATTPEMVERVDLDKALDIYRDRFGDAGDFTFVFVGNIDLAAFRPLVKTYLASLPASGRKETWRDVGMRPPKGIAKRTVKRGTEPKSLVFLTFHGPTKWSTDAENDMSMLAEALALRFREVLREDMSGVYFESTWGYIVRRPTQEHAFSVFFGCSPDNVDKLRKAVFSEIKVVKKRGIGDKYIEKIKNARIRTREVDAKDNWFWSRELADAYRHGDDPRHILSEFDPMVDKVSSKRIRAAARTYLKDRQYALGVLRPEK